MDKTVWEHCRLHSHFDQPFECLTDQQDPGRAPPICTTVGISSSSASDLPLIKHDKHDNHDAQEAGSSQSPQTQENDEIFVSSNAPYVSHNQRRLLTQSGKWEPDYRRDQKLRAFLSHGQKGRILGTSGHELQGESSTEASSTEASSTEASSTEASSTEESSNDESEWEGIGDDVNQTQGGSVPTGVGNGQGTESCRL